MLVNVFLPVSLTGLSLLGGWMTFDHILSHNGAPGVIGPVVCGTGALTFKIIWAYLRQQDEGRV